jgi:hypothetical protein
MCIKQKASDDMRFKGHSRIMGCQYRTLLMWPFWCQKFEWGF